MWFTRRLLLSLAGKRVPVLYFCFEPPRFIYSDTAEVAARMGLAGRVLGPLAKVYRALDRRMVGAGG